MFNNDRKLASILGENSNKTIIFQTIKGNWGRFDIMWNKAFTCRGGSKPEHIGVHREDLAFNKSSMKATHSLSDALGHDVLEMYVINYRKING